MNLADKMYKNNITNNVVRVIDSFEDIAILEGGGKESVRQLLDSNVYTEEIDVSNFFESQNAYNTLVDKIKNLNTNNIIDDDTSNVSVSTIDDGGNLITMSTEEEMRAELAQKYGINDSIQSISTQNELFNKILNKEEKKPDRTPTNMTVSVEDPIISIFKNSKRKVDFKVSIDFNDKIPRLDFIEMMEDSYETSIIDYLANEFTNSILSNPSFIHDIIKKEINSLVFGEEVEKPVEVIKPVKPVRRVSKTVVKKEIETNDR